MMEFAQLSQRLTLSKRRSNRLEVEATPFFELADDAKSQGERHWRIALPLFALIGGLLAVGISRVKPRQGRFARIVPGLTLMLVYYLALLVNQNAIVEEQIPHQAGLWAVHVVFLAVAVFLLRRLAKPGAA
jgi:lipopolysaccharide export system permease protein